MNNYEKFIKKVDNISYINLSDVLKNKDNDKNLEKEITYLNSNKILVVGLYDYVDSKYDSIYKNIKKLQENNLNLKYQELLLKIYFDTNNKVIRNEIINLNISLIPYMINKLHLNVYKDMDELFSVGYEALIKSVEKYDINRNVPFSSYACACIKGNLINCINDRYNLPKLFSSKFIHEKKRSHEDIYTYLEPIDFYESVIDKIYEIGEKSPFWKEMRKRRINIAFPISYDELDEKYYQDYNMDLDYDYEVFKENLKLFLVKLPIKKELLIRLYFNLDNRNLSIKEIIELLNITKQNLYYNIYSLKNYSDKTFGQELLETSYQEIFHEEEKVVIKRK